MRVLQLTENLMAGDAISDHVLALSGLLKELGYETGLYAAHVLSCPPDADARDTHRLSAELREDDLLLYQYSTGSPLNEWVAALRCRKAIVYQNVTPSRFFRPYAPALADTCRLGREQLGAVLRGADMAFASSAYSERELRERGFERTAVMPVLLDFPRYETAPDSALLERLSDGKKNILFVGRKAPNKRIEDVMLSADYYARACGRPCRLILTGDDSLGSYCGMLQDLRRRLSVEILWLGRVSLSELIACYRAAHLFLCMSEHEGFCVPLVESMYFGVPVLAYAAAAVPETLGGSGVTFNRKDLRALAPVMEAMLADEPLRQKIIEGQKQRLAHFSRENIREILRAALEKYI